MTTTYQIRLDEKLKDNFLQTSKQKGLDWSMLIRYFMQTFTAKPEMINFNMDDNFFDWIMQDENVVSKLNKISNKLDKLWF